MVWLAKWILENNPNARVVILTDRIELDKQIERVFHEVGEKELKRTARYWKQILRRQRYSLLSALN